MNLMFSKVEEDVIIFEKDIDGFLKEISSKLDKLDDLDRLQTKVLSIENTIKVNREQLSNRILELETENEGLKKQIKSQCSRTDDILKRVRKLESRITENEKNKISIQSAVAGLDDNSDVIPQIPVESRFEILSEKSNSVIPHKIKCYIHLKLMLLQKRDLRKETCLSSQSLSLQVVFHKELQQILVHDLKCIYKVKYQQDKQIL